MPKLTFSSPDAVSLEKNVEYITKPVETKTEDIENVYEINKCAQWIKSNSFQKVCLQFPDHLLSDSSKVCSKLQNILKQTVYILGDTAYESCCVDYIAAAHLNADSIIHYGPICFSKMTANIPCLNIFEKYELNISEFKKKLHEKFHEDANHITVILDSPYIHWLDDLVYAFEKYTNVNFRRIDEVSSVPKYETVIFLGKNDRKLINIELLLQSKALYYFNGSFIKYEAQSLVLKRRNYIIERIKDSKTIGIVIGTLGVKNYLQVIERIKKLICLSRKKYYLISVGKPTVAKLANFPELDIYVVVTCSMSEIYENRDFYKPIATPFDVEIALNSNYDKNINFSYDYNQFLGDNFEAHVLSSTANQDGDVSLLTNSIRILEPEQEEGESSVHNEIALKSDNTLALNTSHGAGYLADRSWKGLEQNLGQTEAELAQEGRKGIAQRYENEQI